MNHKSSFSLTFFFSVIWCKPQLYYNTFVHYTPWFPVYPFARIPYPFITIVPPPMKDASPTDSMESKNSIEPIHEESSPDDSSIEDLEISSNVEEFLFQSGKAESFSEVSFFKTLSS